MATLCRAKLNHLYVRVKIYNSIIEMIRSLLKSSVTSFFRQESF